MAISDYIKDQLLVNGIATFPGLGSLKLIREPARIDEKKILPPATAIIFTSEISKDDGKLSQSLASGEEISIDEAKQKVLEYIDEILFALNKGEEFIIEGTGKLYRDKDSVIRFDKKPEFILDHDSFGLESFELEQAGTDNNADKIFRKHQPTVEEDVSITALHHADYGESGRAKKNERNSYWIITGSMIVILTTFAVLRMTTSIFDNASFRIFNFGGKNSQSSVVEKDQWSTDNSLTSDMEKSLDSLTKVENALLPEVSSQTTAPVSSSVKAEYREYHIIAGSFRNTANAQDLAQELTGLGYHAVILQQGNDLYRVSALTFNDKETGLRELSNFRARTKNNAAWLLGLN